MGKMLKSLIIISPILVLLTGSGVIGEDDSLTVATLEEKAAMLTSPAQWIEIFTIEDTTELFYQFLDEALDSAGELRAGVEGNLFDTKAFVAASALAGYYELQHNDDVSGVIDQWGEPLKVHQVRDDYGNGGMTLPYSGHTTQCYEYLDFYAWRIRSTGGPIILSGYWMITPRSERLDRYLKNNVFVLNNSTSVTDNP